MTVKIRPAPYPKVHEGLIEKDVPKGVPLGLDLEWNEDKPTIAGIAYKTSGSDKNRWGYAAQSGEWNASEPKLRNILADCPEIVGHNIIGGDLPVLFRHLVFPIIPEKKFDTFIYFYLTNSHLCKARSEKPTEMSYEASSEKAKGAGGFMNIWTMSSLYTPLPNWKYCRGNDCYGPCPQHQPFQYNGVDAMAPLMARDRLEREVRIKKVDHLVPLLEEASFIAARMQEEGIMVDMKALETLETKIRDKRGEVLLDLPSNVNWNSWQQIKAFFRNKYSVEPKTTGEEDMREFFDQYGFEEAGKLVDLKEVGRGLKSWFDKRYIDDNALLHPRFKPCGGTSTGRWASADPNFQNIPVRTGLGKEIRKLIIARPGMVLYKADYKQAEARVVLRLAGYDVPNDGTFKRWMIDTMALDPDDPGVKALGGVWNATKSFMHANHYGEGIALHTKEELRSTYMVNLISKGALEVYRDWTYAGKLVCRTGVNLAARMFGKATFENRKKALDMVRRYFTKFPGVLDWQKSVSRQVEEEGFVRSSFGFQLDVYGQAFPKLKTALAMLGSNPVAMFTNHAICRAHSDYVIPRAQVHDELLFEFPEEMPQDTILNSIQDYMVFEHEAMPEFKLPVDISVGTSWGDTKEVLS